MADRTTDNPVERNLNARCLWTSLAPPRPPYAWNGPLLDQSTSLSGDRYSRNVASHRGREFATADTTTSAASMLTAVTPTPFVSRWLRGLSQGFDQTDTTAVQKSRTTS